MIKIVSYNIDRDVDLKESMTLEVTNRSLFFDFYSMNYKVVNFDTGQQKSKLSTAVEILPDMIKRLHSVTH